MINRNMVIKMINPTKAHFPQIIGHRGARGEAPENTLVSFIHAIEQGTKHFELDVRLSKDGELIVIHDTTTKRTTGKDGIVEQLTLAKLMQYDARKNTAPWPTPALITSLNAIIDACHKHIDSWQFEVKSTRPTVLKKIANKLAVLIAKYSLEEKAVVTSLDKRMVAIMHKHQPQIKRGFVCEFERKAPLETALKYQCSHLCLNWKLVTPVLVKSAKEKGLHVSCWTVNDLNVATQVFNDGVDSIITDFPTAFLTHKAMLTNR